MNYPVRESFQKLISIALILSVWFLLGYRAHLMLKVTWCMDLKVTNYGIKWNLCNWEYQYTDC